MDIVVVYDVYLIIPQQYDSNFHCVKKLILPWYILIFFREFQFMASIRS